MILNQLLLATALPSALAAVSTIYFDSEVYGEPITTITIGNPAQKLEEVRVDFMNDVGVLVNPSCSPEGEKCKYSKDDKCVLKGSKCYALGKSKSYSALNESNGVFGTDTISIGDFKVEKAPLQGSNELGKAAILSLSPLSPFWAAASKEWPQKLLGLFMGRPTRQNFWSTRIATLTLGGLDSELYTGDFTWFTRPATVKSGPPFATEIEKLTINGKVIDLTVSSKNSGDTTTGDITSASPSDKPDLLGGAVASPSSGRKRQTSNSSSPSTDASTSGKAYLQLGTQMQVAFDRLEDQVLEALGAKDALLYYEMSCGGPAVMVFTIAGKDFTVDLKDFLRDDTRGKCSISLNEDAQAQVTADVMGYDLNTGPPIIYLGIPFLASYYTAIDLENNRIGFAELSGKQPADKPAAAGRTTGAVYTSALAAAVLTGVFFA